MKSEYWITPVAIGQTGEIQRRPLLIRETLVPKGFSNDMSCLCALFLSRPYLPGIFEIPDIKATEKAIWHISVS